jgi:hypothetical protein
VLDIKKAEMRFLAIFLDASKNDDLKIAYYPFILANYAPAKYLKVRCNAIQTQTYVQ